MSTLFSKTPMSLLDRSGPLKYLDYFALYRFVDYLGAFLSGRKGGSIFILEIQFGSTFN